MCFFFFDVARKGAYLSYVTAAGVPRTKGKGVPLHGNALYDCILPTLCERGEWCRFFFFKVARKGAYLPYVTAAGVPRTKGKAHPYTETPCLPINYQLCASVKLKITNSVRARRVVQSCDFEESSRMSVLDVRD